MNERIAFDGITLTPDAYGGQSRAWVEQYSCRAQVIYHKGGESVESSRLAGQKMYKFKVKSCAEARAITTDHRLRDARRGDVYNIRETDAISDRAWVYIVAETEVPT